MSVAEHSQPMQALAHANEVRLRRAQLKREVRVGEARLSEVLGGAEVSEWLAGEPIGRLLRSMHRFGTKRMTSLLQKHRISELRPVGGLTYRERRRLVVDLKVLEARQSSGRRARPHVNGVSSIGRAA